MAIDIPEIFEAEDVVFHYTRLSTAIEHILYSGMLRFSPRLKTNDPYEYNNLYFGSVQGFSKDGSSTDQEKVEKKCADIRFEISRIISDEMKILCLCQNDFRHQKTSQYRDYSEFHGFLKLRMWSQYGEGHMGVCLVFSANAIEQTIRQMGYPVASGLVDYVEYKVFGTPMMNIDSSRVREIGVDAYIEEKLPEVVDRLLMRKHIDYSDENEYRICTLVPEKDYLDISIDNSILGIIIGDRVPIVYHDTLYKFGEAFKVDVTRISWDNGQFIFQTKKPNC